MKRFIIVFLMIAVITGLSFGQEDNLTANYGFSFFWESESNNKGGEALVSSSLMFGIGYHVNLIPYILSPGIYGDLHLSFVTFIVWCAQMAADIEPLAEPLLFQAGIRFYNQFKFGPVVLQPFIGLSYFKVVDKSIGLKTFGALAAFGKYGVEYSYQVPLFPGNNSLFQQGNSVSLAEGLHRLTFVIHRP